MWHSCVFYGLIEDSNVFFDILALICILLPAIISFWVGNKTYYQEAQNLKLFIIAKVNLYYDTYQ